MIGLVLVNHIQDACPECLSQSHCQLGFIAFAPFAPDLWLHVDDGSQCILGRRQRLF